MIIDADLRKRKLRDRVPMTYVTSEPYIGHMGLGGVGDSKGLMESELRERHIKWITNAKMTSVTATEMTVQELDDNGALKKEHKLPFAFGAVIPAFKGVDAVAAVPGLCNPRGFVLIDKHQRNPKYKNIYSVGVCVAIPPVEVTPVPTGAPKTGYMIESMVSATAANIAAEIAEQRADRRGDLECDLSCRFRRHRRRLRRAAADPTAQRDVVKKREVGPSGKNCLRKILHAQSAHRVADPGLRDLRCSRQSASSRSSGARYDGRPMKLASRPRGECPTPPRGEVPDRGDPVDAHAETLIDAWAMALQSDGTLAAAHSDREAAEADHSAALRQRWPALDRAAGDAAHPAAARLAPEELDVLQLAFNYGHLETVLNKSLATDLETSQILVKLLKSGYLKRE